jgi:tetratricopeptide (TPR) repeat protein
MVFCFTAAPTSKSLVVLAGLALIVGMSVGDVVRDRRVQSLYNEGCTSFRRKDYIAAAKAWRVAVNEERHHNEDSVSRLTLLAANLNWAGHFADAEPIFLQAIQVGRLTPVEEHRYTSMAISELAYAYQDRGRFSDAEVWFKESIRIRNHLLHKDCDDAAHLNSLANLYWFERRYAEAEPLLIEALKIRRTGEGLLYDSLTVVSLNQLAKFYTLQGRYGEAEQQCRQVLGLREKLLSEDYSIGLAIAMNNLASIYELQERYRDAEQAYKESLSLLRIWEQEHPNAGARPSSNVDRLIDRRRIEAVVGSGVVTSESVRRSLADLHESKKALFR